MILTSALCLYVFPLFFPSQSRITLIQKQKQKSLNAINLSSADYWTAFFSIWSAAFKGHTLPRPKLKQVSSNTRHLSIHCQKWTKSKQPSNRKALWFDFSPACWEYMLNINIESMILGGKKQIISYGIKLKMCPAKKKTAHMQTRSHTHISPSATSQITEPAVFTFMFYLYVCYWRGGVPISLWSLYLHLKSTVCKITELSKAGG